MKIVILLVVLSLSSLAWAETLEELQAESNRLARQSQQLQGMVNAYSIIIDEVFAKKLDARNKLDGIVQEFAGIQKQIKAMTPPPKVE